MSSTTAHVMKINPFQRRLLKYNELFIEKILNSSCENSHT